MFENWRACLGKEPLCNHRPDRGLYIGNFCLPLCARCTGILAGAVGASVVAGMLLRLPAILAQGTAREAGLVLLVGLAMIAPTGIDGVIEYWFGVESNNPRRLITGLLAGVGCALTEMAIVRLL